MPDEYLISGTALLGSPPEARPVSIVVRDGLIISIEDETHVPDRWICPAFFNAHTHLADTVAMDIPCTGSLEELVTPPDGLKHQILRRTSSDRLISSMHSSIREMIHTGTAGFADFREGGPEGVEQIQKAARGEPLHPVILGRQGGEEISDGAGISSARDISGYADIVDRMRKEGKIIAFHAGEKDSEDIEEALACDPDLLVHCTHATHDQIRRIADEKIPVVVCPRSNFLLGVSSSKNHPPILQMMEAGVEILLGTDNAMFVQPDMMQELAFTHTIYTPEASSLLDAATRGFSPSGISHQIKKGNMAKFIVFDVSKGNLAYSHNIPATLVKRTSSGHICARIFYL